MFLDELVRQVKEVKVADYSLFLPEYNLGNNEREIGTLPLELQQFFLFFRKFHADLEKDCRRCHPSRSHMQMYSELSALSEDDLVRHHRLYMRDQFVKTILFRMIADAFPNVISKDIVAIGRGWQVIAVNNPCRNMKELAISAILSH